MCVNIKVSIYATVCHFKLWIFWNLGFLAYTRSFPCSTFLKSFLIHLRHSVLLHFLTCHTFMRKYSSSRTWLHIKYVRTTAALILEKHSTFHDFETIHDTSTQCTYTRISLVLSLFSLHRPNNKNKQKNDMMLCLWYQFQSTRNDPYFPHIDYMFLPSLAVKNSKRCTYTTSLLSIHTHVVWKTNKQTKYVCMYIQK